MEILRKKLSNGSFTTAQVRGIIRDDSGVEYYHEAGMGNTEED